MEPMNNLLKPSEIEILKSLIGEKLLSFQYDVMKSWGNQVFELIGIVTKDKKFVFDNEVLWMENYFTGGDYVPHFTIREVKSADDFHVFKPGGNLITSSVGEKIEDLLLVQDHVTVLNEGNFYQKWDSTEGIIIKTSSKQYAFYKDNTSLDENVNIYKGQNVLSKLEVLEKHWDIFGKPFDASIERKLVSLSKNEEMLLGTCKIAGEDCED